MTTVTSAGNVSIAGTSSADWIVASGNGVTISASSGDDYVISRGSGSFIYGGNDNDTLILLPESSTGSVAGGTRTTRTPTPTTTDIEVHGNAGNDDIIVVHDNAVVYGDAGDDYLTVKLYDNASDALYSLQHVTLTGGDGRDTFSFNSSLPSELENMTTITGSRIEAVITDFSSSAHFCYDSKVDVFDYSILTDAQGNYTDIVLEDSANRLRVTLQGVTNIENVVYATAVRFVDDTLETAYLGQVISNYTEDMSAIPAGITYDNYTVYVSDSYARNVWLMGTDEVNQVSTYRNISAKTLDARSSTRKRTLVGNIRSNIIYAGAGGDSLWGGNGENDTLYGGNGRDMFWYGMGDGADCVRNFVFGSADNSDVLNFYTGGIERAYRSSNTVHISMTTGEELVIPTDYGVDTEIQYSTDATTISRAKIGDYFNANTLTYDAAVNLFMGGSPDNTLSVADSRKNMIWLDGRFGQNYYEITNIDASTSTGDNQLAGADNANINIVGGAGNSSLWGGNGRYSDDTLTGGSGAETFFFGQYEGNDIIIGATADDTINLFNISMSDVTSTESIKGGITTITFRDGDYSLSLQATKGAPTFLFADGSKWTYDKNSWTVKE
ncbi:MAG: hypothetical protein IJT06_02910 [Selenomonadaceae bacterium]|nr:hypothetical protein [Selenomonadaceae bacterium]